jgi:hypothetical protein
MAQDELGKLVVDIDARLDNLRGKYRQAEAETRTLGKNLEKSTTSFSFGKLTIGALKLGVAIQAAQGVLSLFSIATAAAKGDVLGFDKAIRQLPLGLGMVAGQIGDIINEFTGYRDKAEAAIVATEKLRESERKFAEAVVQANIALRERGVALGKASGRIPDDAVAKANKQLSDVRVAMVHRATGFVPSAKELRQQLADAEAILKNALQARNDKLAAANMEAFAADAKFWADRAELAKEAGQALDAIEDQRLAAIESNEAQINKLLAESNALRLDMEGRTLDAQIQRLHIAYQERIAMAREAGNAEAAVLLQDQRDLEIKLAKQQDRIKAEADAKRKKDVEAKALGVGTVTQAAGFAAAGGFVNVQALGESAKSSLDAQRNRLLAEIAAAVKQGAPAVAQ